MVTPWLHEPLAASWHLGQRSAGLTFRVSQRQPTSRNITAEALLLEPLDALPRPTSIQAETMAAEISPEVAVWDTPLRQGRSVYIGVFPGRAHFIAGGANEEAGRSCKSSATKQCLPILVQSGPMREATFEIEETCGVSIQPISTIDARIH